MPGMKISLDAAMRARDVSQPTIADEAAAASMAEAAAASVDNTQPPGRVPADTDGESGEPVPLPGPGRRGRLAPPRRPKPGRRPAT